MTTPDIQRAAEELNRQLWDRFNMSPAKNGLIEFLEAHICRERRRGALAIVRWRRECGAPTWFVRHQDIFNFTLDSMRDEAARQYPEEP